MNWLNWENMLSVLSPSFYSNIKKVLYNMLDFIWLGSGVDLDIYDRNYAELRYLPMEGEQHECFILKNSQDQETLL